MSVEVLDPRRDPEPAYWGALRRRAGLRADWAWPVLAAQAWGTRGRLLVSVLHGSGGPVGVVAATWAGLPARRHSFAGVRGGPWVGGLHVRSPGNQSHPGWWCAEGLGLRELVAEYATGMRRELGRRCVGMLLRQVGDADLAELGRPRVARPTEPVWVLDTAGWRDREDWFRALRRSRRSNLRAVLRLADADVRTWVGGGPDPARVAELLRHNDGKYGGRWVPPAPQLTGYVGALIGQPDVATTTYTDRRSGQLLGVGIILDHPEWPVGRTWAGVPGARYLYFHNYISMVDYAVAGRKPGLVLGKGKAEVKSTLGARPVTQLAVALPSW
ncbi:MAG TPA: GNAT family N-acetyltransferase [Actinophytocola sp.]|jgi:hypothetical protein|uniref:GNAT family N-acetyltransferase n=1 Tax=Actinophytocola sp. TaxID=1872138 RepID=UPI002E057E51|nr:GNAT family N-acetyltransferase [Actinophytocola sp.]